MINLDTNILIRAFTRDDAVQTPQAEAVLASLTSAEPGFISITALTEMAGVLRRLYRKSREEIADIIGLLLRTAEIRVEQSIRVKGALLLFRNSGAEMQDCLVAQSGMDANCEYGLTFDKAAAKLPGMRLLA